MFHKKVGRVIFLLIIPEQKNSFQKEFLELNEQVHLLRIPLERRYSGQVWYIRYTSEQHFKTLLKVSFL